MRRLNSLNLVGDGDDVDLVVEAERRFGVVISDDEAVAVRSAGDYADLIAGKVLEPGARTQACFSQIAFHRLRRAALDLGVAERIAPSSSISSLFQDCANRRDIWRRWRDLGERADLTLPDLCAPGRDRPLAWKKALPGWLDALVSTGPIFLAGAFLGFWVFPSHPIAATFATLLLAGSAYFAVGWARRTVPERLQTVGDLCEEAAGHSFEALMAEKSSCHRNDVWFAVAALCRRETGFRDPIDRQTTFFVDTPRR